MTEGTSDSSKMHSQDCRRQLAEAKLEIEALKLAIKAYCDNPGCNASSRQMAMYRLETAGRRWQIKA